MPHAVLVEGRRSKPAWAGWAGGFLPGCNGVGVSVVGFFNSLSSGDGEKNLDGFRPGLSADQRFFDRLLSKVHVPVS